MDVERVELRDVLHDARSLLMLSENCFDWSSWEDADAAAREIDGLIAILAEGRSPSRLSMSVLFAATGPIQEVSLSSGWAEEYLILATRFDAAEAAFYQKTPYWRRLVNWRPRVW